MSNPLPLPPPANAPAKAVESYETALAEAKASPKPTVALAQFMTLQECESLARSLDPEYPLALMVPLYIHVQNAARQKLKFRGASLKNAGDIQAVCGDAALALQVGNPLCVDGFYQKHDAIEKGGFLGDGYAPSSPSSP